MKGLDEARARIEAIDAELLRLCNERAGIVGALHALKAHAGVPALDAARADAILARLQRLNPGPMRPDQVTRLFSHLLRHFALEYRPGAEAPEEPLLVAGPVRDTAAAARRLRWQGVSWLRLAPGVAPAPTEGMRLVVPVQDAADVTAAPDADAFEAPGADGALAAALAAAGRPVLGPAALKAAGCAEVWTPVTDEAGIAAARAAGAAPLAQGPARAVLDLLAAGAAGALLPEGADDQALADLVHRCVHLAFALRKET